MKKFLSFLVMGIVALSFVGITSCNKDDDDKSKTELLTSGTWKISSVTMNGVDFSSLIPACEKDNTTRFTSTTYTLDEGATKCDEDDPQTETGTWKFIENETKIVSDGDTTNVVEISDSKFRISIVENFNNQEMTTIMTYIH